MMDFLQIVDSKSLVTVSAMRVLAELAVTAISAVVFGVCLRIVPEKLVTRSTATRPSIAAPKTVPSARPRTATAEPKAGAAVKTALPSALSTAVPAASTAAAAPASAAKADSTLDDVLDSFFKDESLLDEALLDAAAPTSKPVVATKPNTLKSKAMPTPTQSEAFSKELAAKMTRQLQPTSTSSQPAKAGAAPHKPEDAAAAAERKLDDALDAYLAEEQLLDEAILDSALQAAHH
ncbi:hypothetical protein ABL78_8367 [Leptomonas seymouri]|uniref:Transmembrane protein n=1 Tax=Leptomonas seymouri TaxID=5684 RepID=A0A0N1HR49_LEPSE|nr:hypothetical protein ABL78_8367 [Leptomonas seymouri]|eukprot:KPI82623.1 hypothetical protein ABL78_8367 [Leptomonas seymouri]